jgi:SSS family solute:Na+ symporter
MLAVYPNENAVKQVKILNPFVLPIDQPKLDSANVGEYTVFETEDKSFVSAFPALAGELKAYNEKTRQAAASAGKTVTTERPIAYKYDTALGQLLGNVLPQKVGLVGFVLAALLGAVVSSLAAMLNAASTIFAMDIYKKLISPGASQNAVVFLGRACVVVFAVIAMALAPQLGNPKISNSIFTIIQESQGFISPGILAVFVFGLVVRRAPAMTGVIGLLTNIIAYGTLKFAAPGIQFLNRMAICFALCFVVMTIITLIKPLPQPIEFRQNTNIDLQPSKGALFAGVIVVLITLTFYVLFSPLVFAK